jgi:phenylpropionate dioxygenase-like ring-hydroxylating dioxygenase large terminal subunit
MSHRIRVDGIEYNAGGFSHADNPHHVGEASQSGPGAMDRSASPIDVQRYLSPEFAQMEWDKMWTRVWLLVAHVAELPAAGSFLTRDIGVESVLVVRGDDGQVRCFHNVCPHRGNLVAHAAEGTCAELRCSYHGWRWDLAGSMLPVPDAHHFSLAVQRCEVGLRPIRSAIWGDFVWLNFDDASVELGDYLGELGESLARYRLPDYALTHRTTVRMGCNWKVFVDGVNEVYHVQTSHPQLLDILDDVDVSERAYGAHSIFAIRTGVPSPRLANPRPPGLVEWLRREGIDPSVTDTRAALRARLQARAADNGWDLGGLSDEQLLAGVNHYAFPNTVFDMHPERGIVLSAMPSHTGPDTTIIHEYVLERLAAARPRPKLSRRSIDYPAQSISPVMDQDALSLIRVQRGMRSRAFTAIRTGAAETRIRRMHDELDVYLRT